MSLSVGDAKCIIEDEDVDFDTPPDSPDDVQLDLSPRLQAELDDLGSTEEYIKKNQEWIARSSGMYLSTYSSGMYLYTCSSGMYLSTYSSGMYLSTYSSGMYLSTYSIGMYLSTYNSGLYLDLLRCVMC